MAHFLFDGSKGTLVDSITERLMGVRKVTVITPALIETLHLWDTGDLVIVDEDNLSLMLSSMELVRAYTDFVDGVGWVWVYEFTELFL